MTTTRDAATGHLWNDERLDGEGPETIETGNPQCLRCYAQYDDPEADKKCSCDEDSAVEE